MDYEIGQQVRASFTNSRRILQFVGEVVGVTKNYYKVKAITSPYPNEQPGRVFQIATPAAWNWSMNNRIIGLERGYGEPVTITEESRRVFEAYYRDAPNWSGNPLVGGNCGGTKEERGNLTQLKVAGLITTDTDEGNTWIYFTAKGHEYAKQIGLERNF